MASTYSTNLKIELMGTGENSGTWGTVTNTNLGTAFEQAVIGLGNPDYTSDANLTITLTNTNASQAARCLVLNVTSAFGSLTATRELIVPTIQKQYIVQNNTTGGQSITVKTSAGTGITVPNGRKAHLYVDGTNVIQMFDFVDINGGAIDGTAIGATSASTGAFTSLTASGATTLNGAVALGDAAGDLITVPGTVNSNLLFTDATYDIGASGATRPRDMFLSRNLTVGGTLTLAGGVNLNGNVTVGDSSADTLTINSTITSNLIFTDNTYDIGASGATRPRSLFLAGNATIGGAQTLTGALTVDSTTDSTSTTTGSIQTDGGVGIAKALFVGTTANIAGVATFSAGSAAAPAITTTGDTNTGIWFPAADTIAFTKGGSESLRIDASGNLLIGTTSGGSKLHVEAPGDLASFYSTSYTAQLLIKATTPNVITIASGTGDTMAIDVGGTTRIAVASATTTLTGSIYIENSNAINELTFTGSDYTNLVSNSTNAFDIGTNVAGPVLLTTNNVERMRILSSGEVGIGTSAPARTLAVNGIAKVMSTVTLGGTVTSTDSYAYFTNEAFANNTDSNSVTLGTVSSRPLLFATSSTERMRINSVGGVGIGVSTIESWTKLQILGTAGAPTTATQQLYISAPTSTVGEGASIRLNAASGGKEAVGIIGVVNNATGTLGSMTFHVYNNGGDIPEWMRLDNSGNLGLGTTPAAWSGYTTLQVKGGSFSSSSTEVEIAANAYYQGGWKYLNTGAIPAVRYEQYSGYHAFFTDSNSTHTAGDTVSFNQAMTLTNGGRLLVGTTTATFPINFRLPSDSGDWFSRFSNTTASSPYGSVFEYTAAAPNGTANEFIFCVDTGGQRMSVRSNGGIANYQANDANLSDRKEKTNFAPAKSYLDIICAIPVQTFNYIDQNLEEDGGLTLGVVAQDVQAVAPELVMESNWGTKEDPKMRLSIYQTDLQYALMKCIQEQQAIIESLKARLDAANL